METKVLDKIDETICEVCDEIKSSRTDSIPALVESLAKLLLVREQMKKN